jgi:hypothetical protein
MTVDTTREKSVIKVTQNGKLQAVTVDRLWTVRDVSAFLGVPVGTLYQWRYLGSDRRPTESAGTSDTTQWPCVLGWILRTPMAGNIQRRPDGKWRARYRDANHREHARHFPRRRDAERWLASQEVAIARGEWVDPTLSKITVGEWSPQWLARQVQLKPTTMVRYEVALRRQILPHGSPYPWPRSPTRMSRVGSTASQPRAWRRRRFATPIGCCPLHSQPQFEMDAWSGTSPRAYLSHGSSQNPSAF